VKLDKKGVYFVLSNSYARPIREMYSEVDYFKIEIVQARRAINSKADKRGPVNEVLVTNVPSNISMKTRGKLSSFLKG